MLRLVRASKNRFGSTDELGVLEMGESGLREVADPGRAFLAEHDGAAPGSVVAATMEGSRPLLVEVQALVAPAGYGDAGETGLGHRSDAPRTPARRARSARRGGPREPRRLRESRRRADGLGTGPGPRSRPRTRLVAPRPPDRPRTVAWARSACSASCARSPGLDRRLREAARLGFERAIVPAGAPARAGHRRHPARAGGEPARSCRGGPRRPPASGPDRRRARRRPEADVRRDDRPRTRVLG